MAAIASKADEEVQDLLEYDIKQFTFPLRKHFNKNKRKFIESNIRKLDRNSKVLDAGCGAGIVTKSLLKDFDLTGIDNNEKAIRYCLNNHGNHYRCCDLNKKLPFENDAFDAVILSETLDHVSNPAFTLNEIRRILKKDGLLLVAVMNYKSIYKIIEPVWYRLFGGNCKPYEKDIHYSNFTKETLENLLKKVFSDVNVNVSNYTMELWGVIKK